MRRASDLAGLAVALLTLGCGGGGTLAVPSPSPVPPAGASAAASASPQMSGRTIVFRDEGVTSQSGHSADAPRIDAMRAGAGLRITAYQGAKRTGGYGIRIERIARVGTELHVHALFVEPAPGTLTTQALTSPAHTVSVDEIADVVILFGSNGIERARVTT